MRKLLSFVATSVVAAVFMTSVAHAQSPVTATWSVAQRGQGTHGGGPLYADNTGGGNVAFSAMNGRVIYQLDLTNWAFVGPGLIDLCFDVLEIKGTSGLPPSFCLGDIGLLPLPVTGTPILIDLFGVPTELRATLVSGH
jgi:hypothetical protein